MFEVNLPERRDVDCARLSRRRRALFGPRVHSIDPAAAASPRIEFGRKLRGAAGSYGGAIGADDQNQYAGGLSGRAPWCSFVRFFRPPARPPVRPFPRLSSGRDGAPVLPSVSQTVASSRASRAATSHTVVEQRLRRRL